jgi:hypothetical protein
MTNVRAINRTQPDSKLMDLFDDCPFEGDRKYCKLYELRGMAMNEKLAFLQKMDHEQKMKLWRQHLECMTTRVVR